MVADELGHLLGFVDMTVSHWQWQANIEHLIVDQPYRRRGVAGRLLAVAERWALGSELTAITAAVQGKNDPAISLLTQRGYAFRGYVDKYFTNGDAAVLYSLSL